MTLLVEYVHGVIDMGETPRRTIRIPEPLWTAAAKKADKYGTTVTAIIRKSLTRWVRHRGELS